MLKLCPRCTERIVSDDSNTDVIHTCNSGNESLDNEDIPNISSANYNFQGLQNKIGGTDAGIDGYDLEDLTTRGNRKSTHTTRQHEEFVIMK
jgi:hypothetical protein